MAMRHMPHDRFQVTNHEFLRALFRDIPEGAALTVCGFEGDPNSPPPFAWAVRPVTPQQLEGGYGPQCLFRGDWNTYAAVSTFYKAGDGNYRRRKSCFAALHAIMVDDLGTGLGSKLGMSQLKPDPTALVETSPDNYQAWMRLREPVRDLGRATRLIKAMIRQGFLAAIDPGMDGVTRVGRLPVGINAKPKYGGNFKVRLAEFEPDVAYSVDEIVAAFGLELDAVPGASAFTPSATINACDDPYLKVLTDLGMVQGPPEVYDGSLRVPIQCPWIEEHTDRADTGAAYFTGGGFRCHHSHGENLHFRDVKTWLRQTHGIDTAELDRIAQAAKDHALLIRLRHGGETAS